MQDAHIYNLIDLDEQTLVLDSHHQESDIEEYYEKNTYKRVGFSYEPDEEEPIPCTCSENCTCGTGCTCGEDCVCDEIEGDMHPIVGVWEWITREVWDEAKEYHSTEELGGEYYEFKPDYTGSISWEDGTSYQYRWSIEESVLTIDYWEHYEDKHVHPIESITYEYMILTESGDYPDGKTWGDRQTYKRIK